MRAMSHLAVLAATWDDGLFVHSGSERRHELAGQAIAALAPDGNGGALAIVAGHTLRRRGRGGDWTTVLTADQRLSCCIQAGGSIHLGTDDARVLE